MLPAEPGVLLARQGWPDAQIGMQGGLKTVGFYPVSWYGTDVDDERGSFAVVSDTSPLFLYVGDFMNVRYRKRDVNVYVIGSKANLLSDIALTRRAFLAIALLANDPLQAAKVSLIL